MKLLTSAIIGASMFATQAVATTLSIVGGTAGVLPLNFDPDPAVGVGPGASITIFEEADFVAGDGLQLDGDAEVIFTFLGKEAAATNIAVELSGGYGDKLFNTDAAGTSISADFTAGMLDFLFGTFNGGLSTITNGVGVTGPSGPYLSIGFLQEDDNNVLAFFGDGTGDLDYDDMVIRITSVPLPAGMLLMLTAIGGLGVASRRRKA